MTNAREAEADVPRRLRIAIAAADPETEVRLAATVAHAGHQVVAPSEVADAILTDGFIEAAFEAPIVVLGAAEGDFAGLLPADAGPEQLDAALRAVAVGLSVRPRPAREPRFGPLPETAASALTPREVEVLTALAEGLSNKAAARRLGISPHTVKFHLEELFRKLGAGCRAEAVAQGLKRQIVEF